MNCPESLLFLKYLKHFFINYDYNYKHTSHYQSNIPKLLIAWQGLSYLIFLDFIPLSFIQQ